MILCIITLKMYRRKYVYTCMSDASPLVSQMLITNKRYPIERVHVQALIVRHLSVFPHQQ